MIKKLYVAYGSNLHKAAMAYRCKDARPLGASELVDYKLVFNGCATIEECEGSVVPVGIWAISDADEERLDEYEGYPDYYTKKVVNFVLDGKMAQGIVYIMNDCYEQTPPSKYYADVVRKGYEDFGLDNSILETAIEESYKKELIKM